MSPLTTNVTEPLKTYRRLYRDDNLSCGGWSDFFLLVWHNETTEDGVRAMSGAFATFENGRDAHSGQESSTGILTVIEPNAPLPAHEARRAMARFLADRRRQIAASAVVFEGAGFRAAAVRGVVTGLTMVAQQSFPHRVFSEVQDAAAWMCGAGRESWVGQGRILEQALAKTRR